MNKNHLFNHKALLLFLTIKKEKTLMPEICKLSVMSQAAIYMILRKFETEKLVIIEKVGRCNFIMLTEKGIILQNIFINLEFALNVQV
jgi:DNA-binding MarR family transcriptional regulator